MDADPGLKTLAVRVTRQNENALRVAEYLGEHGKVGRVHYPFLKSHPQHAVARAADERRRRHGDV